MSWTKLRLAMMNNSMLNSTCSSVKTTSVTIASIQGLLKKITAKSSTRTQQTEPTYFIKWWAKRPAHQQGSDKSSKRRQSQKLVSHSILCTGPIENLIIVMGDITKTYVFFSQDDISDNSKHSRSPEE